MSSGQAPRRSSSAKGGTKAPSPASRIGRIGKVHKERSGPVLTATVLTKEIRCLPSDLHQCQQQISANKVVLCFESEFSTQAAWAWLRTYNLSYGAKLSLANELPHAVFVVQFEADDWPGTKRALLAASPLKAGEAYASVNDFVLHLYPCHNPAFKHLVTVNLVQANQELVGIEEFVTEGIGNFVTACQGTDPRRITVVVETTLKLFPSHELFRLDGSDTTKVNFDYRGRNLRCCYCFSYRHLSSQCRQPKPSLFSSPNYTVDAVTTVSHNKGQKLQGGGASSSRDQHKPRAAAAATGAAVIESREIGPREQSTEEGTASKHRRNRPRQRTGKPSEVSVTPASTVPICVLPGAGVTSTAAATAAGPASGLAAASPEAATPEVIFTSQRSTPAAGAAFSQGQVPAQHLSAEGWSPHPSGRDLGQTPGIGAVGNCTSNPLGGSPSFGRTNFGACPGSRPVASTPTGAEEFYRGLPQHRSPGSSKSVSRNLTVALFEGAPRKRLRSDYTVPVSPLTANTDCSDERIRPPPHNFKSVDTSLQTEDQFECLPFPNHETLGPLLLQCAGTSVPDSQDPC